MSRSYKKYPCWKDRNSQFGKRSSVKAVRRTKELSNGASYKKYYCSWNICDYRIHDSFMTAESFRRKWEDPRCIEHKWLRRRFRTWKEAYRYWRKCIAK